MASRQQKLPRAARTQYAQQKALAQGAKNATGKLWREVDPSDISGSWESGVGQAVLSEVRAAQLRAASLAEPYVEATAPKNGRRTSGVVRPQAFAGVASDGRDLDSLLLSPVVKAKRQIAAGHSVSHALEVGGRNLGMIVVTQVQDAGRDATQAAMLSRPWVIGWVRVLSLPACGRCAVLAGKFYLFNEGFLRHPQCDCGLLPGEHMPADPGDLTDKARQYKRYLEGLGASERPTRSDPTAHLDAEDITVNVRNYFEVLTPEEQDRYFGKSGAEAIRLGADPAQVVNARRKGAVYVAGTREFTREGVVRKRKGKTRPVRITPAQILREAGDDRDEAVRLLKLHRYVL